MYPDILNQTFFLVIAELGVSWEYTKPELDKKHWVMLLQKQNQETSSPQHSQCSCLMAAGAIPCASFLPASALLLGALLDSVCGAGALYQLLPRAPQYLRW